MGLARRLVAGVALAVALAGCAAGGSPEARLRDRVENLDKHFGHVTKDIAQIVTSADKIMDRGERIQQVEFGGGEAAPDAAPLLSAGAPRIQAAE